MPMNNTPALYESIPDILTVQQLQKILGIGRKAAYDLIQENKIKHIRIGRNIRIPKRCLLDFIENSCYNAPTATNRLPEETEV